MCVRIHDASAHQSTRTRASVRPRVRRYRAPEVILWSPISHCADTWSVGCVIAEIALGVPLLPGESEYNQLARIYATFGPPPASLLSRSRRADTFFYKPRGSDVMLLREARAKDEPPLVRYVPHDHLDDLVDHVLPKLSGCERTALLCVLDGLLQWDPHQRWSGDQLVGRFREELAQLECDWPPDLLRGGHVEQTGGGGGQTRESI